MGLTEKPRYLGKCDKVSITGHVTNYNNSINRITVKTYDEKGNIITSKVKEDQIDYLGIVAGKI